MNEIDESMEIAGAAADEIRRREEKKLAEAHAREILLSGGRLGIALVEITPDPIAYILAAASEMFDFKVEVKPGDEHTPGRRPWEMRLAMRQKDGPQSPCPACKRESEPHVFYVSPLLYRCPNCQVEWSEAKP